MHVPSLQVHIRPPSLSMSRDDQRETAPPHFPCTHSPALRRRPPQAPSHGLLDPSSGPMGHPTSLLVLRSLCGHPHGCPASISSVTLTPSDNYRSACLAKPSPQTSAFRAPSPGSGGPHTYSPSLSLCLPRLKLLHTRPIATNLIERRAADRD